MCFLDVQCEPIPWTPFNDIGHQSTEQRHMAIIMGVHEFLAGPSRSSLSVAHGSNIARSRRSPSGHDYDQLRQGEPLPPEIYKEYCGLLPRACRLTTTEVEEYEATMRIQNGKLSITEGWGNFMTSESIEWGYLLVFYRHSLFDLEIWIIEANGCGRQPVDTFTLDIKKTHVERARLFWRVYIKGCYENTNVVYLVIGQCRYEMEIFEGHGKKLLQRGATRSFVEDNGIVENCSCKFILVPAESITFKVEM
ncbi:Unknown protein [Striga hermonthica]|uniref:Uncharacterized protein n=1 Tax=Striga hermonthica TaxID=68872 RepID=A0A9N7MJ70_STRHE|nr:Unknown protein [Striga hermonthica]